MKAVGGRVYSSVIGGKTQTGAKLAIFGLMSLSNVSRFRNICYFCVEITVETGLTGFDSVKKWSVSMQSNDGYAL
jgi:hypothetical protein